MDELRTAVARAERKLAVVQRKLADFRHNEFIETDRHHHQYLHILFDDVRDTERELNNATRKLREAQTPSFV